MTRHGAIVVIFEEKLKLTYHQIGAELKPRRLQTAHTSASIAHDLRAKFPFKKHVFSLLFLNF